MFIAKYLDKILLLSGDRYLKNQQKRGQNELLDKSSLTECYKDQIFKVLKRIYVIDYI